MPVCSKCKLEKENNQFYTYWHSTQQKYRTRRECQTCFYKKRIKEDLRPLNPKDEEITIPTKIIEPEPPESKIEVLEDNIPTKICSICKKDLPVDKFYKWNARCKDCSRIKHQQETSQDVLDTLAGGERIPVKPGVYADISQKNFIFSFLPKLGWIFNEQTNSWYKPGLKEINGIWPNVQPDQVSKSGRKLKLKSNLVWFNNKKVPVTDELIKKMYYLYTEQRYTITAISQIYKTSPKKVKKWVEQKQQDTQN